MGLGQGSRGASQGSVQTSPTKGNVLKRCDYGAESVHPISKSKSTSVGGVFIDDTNMYVFNKDCNTGAKLLKEPENK